MPALSTSHMSVPAAPMSPKANENSPSFPPRSRRSLADRREKRGASENQKEPTEAPHAGAFAPRARRRGEFRLRRRRRVDVSPSLRVIRRGGSHPFARARAAVMSSLSSRTTWFPRLESAGPRARAEVAPRAGTLVRARGPQPQQEERVAHYTQGEEGKAGGAAAKRGGAAAPAAAPQLGPILEPTTQKSWRRFSRRTPPCPSSRPPTGGPRLGARTGGARWLPDEEASPGSSDGGAGGRTLSPTSRSEAAAKETARNEMRRQVLAEEESFFELGDGRQLRGVSARATRPTRNDDDDDDDARADVDDEWEDDDGISELDMRYREGQARGAVEFDLGEELEDGWEDDDEGGGVARAGFPARCAASTRRRSRQGRRRRPRHGGVPPRGVRRPGRTLRR